MDKERGYLLVLTGPSGTGKTSVCREILELFDDVRFSVSYTTRKARPGEEHGRDYFFVDDATFDGMLARDAFAEWAVVHGNRYGTSRAQIEEQVAAGRVVLLDIDPQGAHQLKKIYEEAVFVFFLAPTFEVLRQRLVGRGTESAASLERRLARARDEVRECTWYDYLIVNDEFDRAVEQFTSVIVAERARTSRSTRRIARLWEDYDL